MGLKLGFVVLVFVSIIFSGCFSFPPVCTDVDADGYGVSVSSLCNYSGIDCDDSNAQIHPGATEVCGNGKDDDCVDGDKVCAPVDGCLRSFYFSNTFGVDSNAGTSMNTSKKTLAALQSMLNISQPGDCYLLKRGDTWTQRGNIVSSTYSGVVGLDLKNVDGTTEKPITIGAYGEGNKPTFDFSGRGAAIQFGGSTNIIIQDIFFTSSESSISNRPLWALHAIGHLDGKGQNVTFLKLETDGLGAAFWVQDYHDSITIDSCALKNGFDMGIYGSVPNIKIINSLWINNGINDPNDPGLEHDIYIGNANGLIIRNNTFHESFNAISVAGGKNITITDNHIYNQAVGMELTGVQKINGTLMDVLISRNSIHDVDSGIWLSSHTSPGVGSRLSNIRIVNNLFYDIDEYLGGLFITDTYNLDNFLVANNLFFNTAPFAINIPWRQPEMSNNRVMNNIFYSSTGSDLIKLKRKAIDQITWDYNLYYTSGNLFSVDGTNYSSLSSFRSVFSSDEQHGIFGNPLFVNVAGNNFHLSVGSPAIDNGTNVGVMDDFDGLSRPVGAGFDVGAFEYR